MNVKRLDTHLKADPKKVILQFLQMNEERTVKVTERIQALESNEIKTRLEKIYSEFSNRHKDFENLLLGNYKRVEKYLPGSGNISEEKKLLIGSYFSKEYSIEAAALFNPSIVPHPDQSGMNEGELKFILSLRATGEGHISSIEFREGIISTDGKVKLITDSEFRVLPEKITYTADELTKKKYPNEYIHNNVMEVLLDVNYRCKFDSSSTVSERVLFPNSSAESMGLEDARFVKFSDGNESTYFATYTAYNGKTFGTQLIETKDFEGFEIGSLHGNVVKDKGMAIFPRKINGKYFITSRQDGENLYMMESDDIYHWNKAEKIMAPSSWWDFIQLGNCGSPIETEKGWLLITHAVGPFRKYVISAVLLDLENPYKVIGKLNEPLIEPNEVEREGYVPNVVYSCGSLLHKENLIIPYAMSDSACGFAKIELNQLLQKFS